MDGVVPFIVVFSLLIFVHELGHFVTAKINGVFVQEFGFGYPPRLLYLGIWRGTEITLNALPIGGFVRMSEDDPTAPGSLATKSWRVRALVYFAGALMNLVLAIVLYSVTFMVGALTPVDVPGSGIYYVSPGSPAETVDMRPGDNIVIIDHVTIGTPQDAIDALADKGGVQVEIVLERDGEPLEPILVTPRVNPPEGEGALGISLDLPLYRVAYPIWEAIPLGFRATFRTIAGIFEAMRQAMRGLVPFQVTGPIGIYETTREAAQTGIERLIEFSAFLSINLFLMNLLPLPALDGGRLIFVLIEVLRGGRRVPPEKEGMVHALGMLALLILMAVVTFQDYLRYFG